MSQRKIRDLSELKENLRAQVDIVAFIGRYVTLSQQGKNWFGLCPFHDDSTPSFNVSPLKKNPQGHALGLWSCLGCRKAGDLYRFVEEFHRCGFIEAIEIVAETVGFDLTPYYRELTPEEQFLDSMYSCTDQIATLLNEQLMQEPKWLAFFEERGITPESLQRFKVGYCPSLTWLEERVDEGLFAVIEPSHERREMLFGGRLLYPQYTASGDIWGWYARTDGKPKYWGPSRESRLFRSDSRLYGLHLAKRMMRGGDVAVPVLVEGFHDAIAAQQHGFAGIAICGTELTADQIQTLHEYSVRSAVVVLDGDEGGRAGMLRLALRANEIKDIDLKFASVPGDPDEFLTQHGRDAFAQLIHDAIYAIEYVLVKDDHGALTSATAQLDFLNRVRPIVAVYPRNSIQRAVAIRILAEKLTLPMVSIEDFFDESLRDDPLVNIVGEQVVLAELLCGANAFVQLNDVTVDYFSFVRHRTLFTLLQELYRDAVEINPELVSLETRNRGLGKPVLDLIEHLQRVDRQNLLAHLADVREKSLRRRAEAHLRQSSTTIRDMKRPATEILSELTEDITSLVIRPTKNTLITAAEATDAAVLQCIERQTSDNKIAGLDLGPEWSHLMGWINGFRPGRVHIVAALSGVGKSVVGLANWVERLSVAEDGPHAAGAIFSLEMSAVENTNRITAINAGVPEKFISHGRFETQEQVDLTNESFVRVRESKLTWVERILSVPDIAFQCRILKTKGRLDYIVIDYLQLLDLSPYNDRWSKTEKFGQASQDLHDLAEDLGVPIIAMAQLRRAAYDDEIHTGEDMAEAYKFYQDCHECFTLTPRADKKILGFLDKNRGGPSKKVVDLVWDNDEQRATLKVTETGVSRHPI